MTVALANRLTSDGNYGLEYDQEGNLIKRTGIGGNVLNTENT
jgi:YD repeat-containing protein